MKLIDFRFVLRDGEIVLQVRHRDVHTNMGTPSQLRVRDYGIDPGEWGDWEDVPMVDLDEEKP